MHAILELRKSMVVRSMNLWMRNDRDTFNFRSRIRKYFAKLVRISFDLHKNETNVK